MVSLNLEGMRILVVGGGKVAARKVRGLPLGVASVTLVSEEISGDVEELLRNLPSRVLLLRRSFSDDDMAGADVVFAATSNALVNRHVAFLARKSGLLVNDVSDQSSGNFSNAFSIQRGGVSIGVATNPKVPGFARSIGKLIDEALPEHAGVLLRVAANVRRAAIDEGRSLKDVDWMKAFDPEIVDLVRRGELSRAEESLTECLW